MLKNVLCQSYGKNFVGFLAAGTVPSSVTVFPALKHSRIE